MGWYSTKQLYDKINTLLPDYEQLVIDNEVKKNEKNLNYIWSLSTGLLANPWIEKSAG